jgi:hypothetical protein
MNKEGPGSTCGHGDMGRNYRVSLSDQYKNFILHKSLRSPVCNRGTTDRTRFLQVNVTDDVVVSNAGSLWPAAQEAYSSYDIWLRRHG